VLDLLKKLLHLEAEQQIEVKPGYTALGFGSVHLKVRVFREADGKWHDLEEIKS